MMVEQQAWNHIQNYHLNEDGMYLPFLEWSTPTEEVAHMQARGICQHASSVIYCERDHVK